MDRDVSTFTNEFRKAISQLISSLEGVVKLVDYESVAEFFRGLLCDKTGCYHSGHFYFSYSPISLLNGVDYRWNCSQSNPVSLEGCPHSIFVRKLNSRKTAKSSRQFVRQKVWEFKIVCAFTRCKIYTFWCEKGAESPCAMSCAKNCEKYTRLSRLLPPDVGLYAPLWDFGSGQASIYRSHALPTPQPLYNNIRPLPDKPISCVTPQPITPVTDQTIVSVSEEELLFLKEFMSPDEICRLGW